MSRCRWCGRPTSRAACHACDDLEAAERELLESTGDELERELQDHDAELERQADDA